MIGGALLANLPSGLKYAESHEWVGLGEQNVVKVGITDHAQEELGDLVFIELPEVGRRVSAGEQCAVVESVKAASDIYSPVSGVIADTNGDLADSPEKVNDDAFSAWLFSVKIDDANELEKLMDADGYSAMIKA